jgi:hypothetical protein
MTEIHWTPRLVEVHLAEAADTLAGRECYGGLDLALQETSAQGA